MEAGLVQRVKALNAFLHDIYHEQDILRAGKVPSDLVLGNPQYQKEMRGVDLPNKVYTHISGIDLVRISYKGTGPAVTALIAGESQVSFPNAGSAMAHVKSGRLKALAVCSAQPSALAPGLPTVTETGLPGYESVSPQALFAPAKMPPALVNRINAEVLKVMRSPEVRERFFNTGMEVAAGTPQELGAAVKSEMARMGKVIKAVGIREE